MIAEYVIPGIAAQFNRFLCKVHKTDLEAMDSTGSEAPLADNTKLCGALLTIPSVRDFKESQMNISPGKQIQIFQVVPIHQEEMDCKIKNGAEKLEELRGDQFRYVVDPARKNAVTGE